MRSWEENGCVRVFIWGQTALLALALAGSVSGIALTFPPQSGSRPHDTAPADKVDINAASLDELLRVPGMTHTWAARIIRFRPYRAKNDLLDRGVVTSQVYDRIKDYIIAHRLDR